MATNTTNLKLKKPDFKDPVDVTVLNGNFDTIDNEINNRKNEIGDISTLTTTTKSSAVAAINENVNKIGNLTGITSDLIIDVKYPPAPLVAAKGDGTTDDTTAIQNILNSLKGKTGRVYLSGNNVYVISSTLIIPETIELYGTISARFGRTGSDVPTTILKWTGAINGIMLKYQKDVSTTVWGAKVHDLTFDANSISGVTCLDMTNSAYGLVENCSFTQMANGIYINGNYYNIIRRNAFEYFTGTAINLDSNPNYANDNSIEDNYIQFRSNYPNAIGIFVKGANSTKIVLNRFQGYASGIQPIHIEGSNALDTSIGFNRFEHQWQLDASPAQTPIYAITIANVNGSPRHTNIMGNQFYLEETISGSTYYNYQYAINDQGYGTICDDFIDDNFIPNGCLKLFNGAIPIWKSSDSSYTFSYDTTEDAVALTVNNSTVKYPNFYNIIDAKKFRNRNVVVSCKFKCSNITTMPKLEVFCYKGGDGTYSNLGTYESSMVGNINAYKSGDYMLLTATLTVPSDSDNIWININPNGQGATTPANNTIWLKFISIADKRCLKANPNRDIINQQIKMVYSTASRPPGTKGMMIIDSTLNKIIWHDGTQWRDATGTVV